MAALQNPVLPPPCDKIDFTILGLTLATWNALAMAAILVVLYFAFKNRKAS
jgi:disulfide bond formation protein DsbB